MKKDWEIYRDTGMLGIYQPESAIVRRQGEGVSVIFRDTVCRDSPEGFIKERDMLIEGRRFHVTSVFPGEGEATPTAKMLSLIDADLGKSSGAA